LALVILIAGFLTLYYFLSDKPVLGSKSFTIEVVDDKSQTKTYESRTDAEFLGEAVKEIKGLKVEGEKSQYGLMIESVNGLSTVYEKDGAYWGIFVNGNYATQGIDTQPVKDGDKFKLVYTIDSGQS
jgi:hypothetical protein